MQSAPNWLVDSKHSLSTVVGFVAAAAIVISPIPFVGAVYAAGAAHADCPEGSSYTSQDSGITYHCVRGQYHEGPYGGLPRGVPGNGVFRVGVDVAPGTYRTNGPTSAGATCSWATHRTLGAGWLGIPPIARPDDVSGTSDIVDGNASTGQLYAKIPPTVAAFETNGCQPWQRVSP
jgi:hypothetical protein